MAIFLKDIYEDTKQTFGIELVAGAGGLDNIMGWVYVTEDDTTTDFLNGGELVITTGALCSNCRTWLMTFVRHMVEHHTCGLVINTGKYILPQDIPQNVLDYCEQHDFPLFIMPWKTRMYDITKEYYNRIFLDTNRHMQLSNAFLRFLNGRKESADALSLLTDYGFTEHAPYQVAVFALSEDMPSASSGAPLMPAGDHLFHIAQGQLMNPPCPCHLIVRNYSMYLICQSDSLDIIHRLALQIQSRLQPALGGYLPAVGIGGCIKELQNLSVSCRQAYAALKMGSHKGEACYLYEDMGFFKLLLGVSDRDILTDYAAGRLSAVHDYDRKHNSDFARTLYLYLLHQNSIQAAADASFCHRNTVNHRIRIIREELGLDLDDAIVCMELMTAFLIEEYLDAF